jgi:hypothetical protein
MAPIKLYPFRFRDPRTGKWVRARYVVTLAELASRYREWEIIGPAEIRGDAPVLMFEPQLPRLTDTPLITARDPGRPTCVPRAPPGLSCGAQHHPSGRRRISLDTGRMLRVVETI